MRTTTYSLHTPGSLIGVKRLEREGNNSPLNSVKIKVSGAIPPFPLYAFMTLTRTASSCPFTVCSGVNKEHGEAAKVFITGLVTIVHLHALCHSNRFMH